MDIKIILTTILVISALVGFTYGINQQYGSEEGRDFYSEEMSLVVNSSNSNAEIEFENNTVGLWFQDGEFFFDMNGDGSFESELSEAEMNSTRFVREAVRGEKAYQIYFRYNETAETSSLVVYRVRRI